MTSGPKFQLGLLFAATVALGVPWGWFKMRAPEPDQPAPTEVTQVEAAQAEAREPEQGPPVESRAEIPAEAESAPSARAPETVERPHPITPMHEALAERRELIGALVGALEDQRYDKARSLLGAADELQSAGADRHSSPLDPEGSNFGAIVQGYRLILDCLAARSTEGAGELPDELREASRKYLDEQRLPPRREVRRVCLEGRPFARRV